MLCVKCLFEYYKYNIANKKSIEDKEIALEEDIKTWTIEFVQMVLKLQFDIILTTNYLNIKNLLDLTCQTIAELINDMPNMKNDTYKKKSSYYRKINGPLYKKNGN